LNLLLDLQLSSGPLSLVSHLNVVRRVTRRTAVMYLGQIVDVGATRDLFAAPAHPYTAALLSTNPAVDPRRRHQPIVLQGEIPSAVNPPSGCRFHTRCPVAQPLCATEPPVLREVDAGRRVRCHFPFSLENATDAVLAISAGASLDCPSGVVIPSAPCVGVCGGIARAPRRSAGQAPAMCSGASTAGRAGHARSDYASRPAGRRHSPIIDQPRRGSHDSWRQRQGNDSPEERGC
jgi:oligopeptide/dipeptide ABC transporter ATP-binding protein